MNITVKLLERNSFDDKYIPLDSIWESIRIGWLEKSASECLMIDWLFSKRTDVVLCCVFFSSSSLFIDSNRCWIRLSRHRSTIWVAMERISGLMGELSPKNCASEPVQNESECGRSRARHYLLCSTSGKRRSRTGTDHWYRTSWLYSQSRKGLLSDFIRIYYWLAVLNVRQSTIRYSLIGFLFHVMTTTLSNHHDYRGLSFIPYYRKLIVRTKLSEHSCFRLGENVRVPMKCPSFFPVDSDFQDNQVLITNIILQYISFVLCVIRFGRFGKTTTFLPVLGRPGTIRSPGFIRRCQNNWTGTSVTPLFVLI
jgi:hypothetical protein